LQLNSTAHYDYENYTRIVHIGVANYVPPNSLQIFSNTTYLTVDSNATALAAACHVTRIASSPAVARQSHSRPLGQKVWPPVGCQIMLNFQKCANASVLVTY